MPQETIIVEITAEAEVKVTTQGYSGKACLEATRSLEEALGEVSSNEATAEMQNRGVRHEQHRHRA